MYSSKNIDILLNNLAKSKFRGSFHLNMKMKEYVNKNGLEKIKSDARCFVEKRLKPAVIDNDGKQTPQRQVHPVFIAQHASGCCCRGCLEKIHKIPKGYELTDFQINYIVNVIMRWIERESQ